MNPLRAARRVCVSAVVFSLILVPACGGDDEPAGPDGPDDVVGPDGGTLTFEDGKVSLSVPAGAVSSDLQVSVAPGTGPASELLVAGTTWDLGPDGTTFASPVTLTVGYESGALPAGVREAELVLARSQGGGWQPVPGSVVNAGANSVAAPLSGFSVYGVVGVPVASLTITPDPATVEAGGTVTLEASPRSEGGMVLPDRSVDWSSEDPSVATVDDQGVVSGVSEGSTTVTASVEGVEATVTVTVQVSVAVVEVEPAEAELTVGQSLDLSATPRAGDGSALDREVVWSSSAESVATVDGEGRVDAVGEGSTTISATSEGVEGTAAITVTNPVASIELSAPVQGIVAGGTTQLTATLRDGGGNVLDDREVTWSSSDEAVATVDADGLVTTLATGVVTLTAMSEGVEATVELTVTLDWSIYAGAWSGSWTNTTFASTDAIDATLTIDIATLTATLILDVDGPVFGMSDPLPMTIVAEIGATAIHVDYDAPLHGRVVVDLEPGAFDIESESVPASGFEAWTFTGTIDETTLSGDFTIEFTGGGDAEGTVEVTRQG